VEVEEVKPHLQEQQVLEVQEVDLRSRTSGGAGNTPPVSPSQGNPGGAVIICMEKMVEEVVEQWSSRFWRTSRYKFSRNRCTRCYQQLKFRYTSPAQLDILQVVEVE
jgi:hypothetical protein